MNNISIITFSPTGQSKACVLSVARATKKPYTERDVTQPLMRSQPLYCEDSLILLGFPVYGGRVPTLFSAYLKDHLTCKNCKAVAVATYGNRAYDDALVEIEDLLMEKGVPLVGCAAMVCQHSYTDKVGEHRPDILDFQLLDQLAVSLEHADDAVHPAGNRPYKKSMVLATPSYMPVLTESLCNQCMQCADVCPTGALQAKDSNLCIHCCACIKVCTHKALRMEDPRFFGTVQNLETFCRERQNSELFLA
ncbi:MAG: hypothetical protein EOM15_17260 [Spirochaetia bacterium]|nr:4Fe-4S binding protein [Sphaerochaeta sp.]NCC66388.1 hypothetical protein [Spirochaetia bacterium]